MSALDAAIRAWLDEQDAETAEFQDADAPRAALRAVLDLVRDSRDPAKGDGLGLLTDWEIEATIARALGVSAS